MALTLVVCGCLVVIVYLSDRCPLATCTCVRHSFLTTCLWGKVVRQRTASTYLPAEVEGATRILLSSSDNMLPVPIFTCFQLPARDDVEDPSTNPTNPSISCATRASGPPLLLPRPDPLVKQPTPTEPNAPGLLFFVWSDCSCGYSGEAGTTRLVRKPPAGTKPLAEDLSGDAVSARNKFSGIVDSVGEISH